MSLKRRKIVMKKYSIDSALGEKEDLAARICAEGLLFHEGSAACM
jgi:hypothetical protein